MEDSGSIAVVVQVLATGISGTATLGLTTASGTATGQATATHLVLVFIALEIILAPLDITLTSMDIILTLLDTIHVCNGPSSVYTVKVDQHPCLQLFLVQGFGSFQLPDRIGPALLFIVTTSLSRDWVICAPAAFLGCGSRFSGSLSGIEP